MEQKSFILLDRKIVQDFREQAKKTSEYPLDCGRMTFLKKELMELCGVTELEAFNILCGKNIDDYIKKYAGRAEGKHIDIKEYSGEVQVVYKITEEERDLYEES